jgi:hypothetical protein
VVLDSLIWRGPVLTGGTSHIRLGGCILNSMRPIVLIVSRSIRRPRPSGPVEDGVRRGTSASLGVTQGISLYLPTGPLEVYVL